MTPTTIYPTPFVHPKSETYITVTALLQLDISNWILDIVWSLSSTFSKWFDLHLSIQTGLLW